MSVDHARTTVSSTARGRRARPALAALGAVVLLGAGLVAPASAGTTAPFCGIVDLAASYRATDAGAGHRFGEVVLRNTSGRTCRTHGYGGISYVDDLGRQVGAPATRTPAEEPVLVLRPGQRAVSVLDEAVAADYPRSRCRPRAVTSLQVYGPEWEAARFVAHRTTGCASTTVHLLAHRPYTRP